MKKRSLIQTVSTLLSNIHLKNFFTGSINRRVGKNVCLPGLNCYSCPGAAGVCPIGSFQTVVGSSKYSFSYYVVGLLLFFGVLFGRLICGLFCPFGFFQDLLHKIPSKKFSTKKLKALRYIKYFVLVFVVFICSLVLVDKSGLASPYFCKYICPQGILEGAIPLAIANKGIRGTLGKLFILKLSILITTIVLSILYYRPFCKWICPLGAFYSLLNKYSFYQYKFNKEACISCGRCKKACKMDVDITKNQSHLECIRCGACLESCPKNAITTSIREMKGKLKMKKITLSLALLFSIFTFSGCSQEITTNFPNFTGKDFEGKEVSQDIFKEKKLTVINYWFTGCKACVEEMPLLEKLGQDLKEKNVELLGLCVEDLDQEGMEKAKDLLNKAGVTYRNITVEHSQEADAYLNKIMAFPTTIIVDQNGNIVGDEVVGSLDEAGIEKLMNQVDSLLEKEAK